MNQLRRFFQSRWDEVLIFGFAIQLIVWALTTGNLTLILAVTLSMVVMVLLIYFVTERITRRKSTRIIGENAAFRIPRTGLIFSVGRQTDTIAFAIKHQNPKWVGLVCSKDTEPQANALMTQTHLPTKQIRKWLVDAFDVQEIHTTALMVIEWMFKMGLRSTDIAVDPTGGTTIMSLGTSSAADEHQIDTQYIRSEYDENNTPIKGTQEGIFIVRYTMMPLANAEHPPDNT